MIKNFKKLSQRQGLGLILLACVTLFSGCAALGFKQPEPVTVGQVIEMSKDCLLYTSPSPRDRQKSRMPSSA